ncbi:hypothetical protein JEU11_06660 [Paraglaciecola chathamensis]|uniref:Uncharacterized protein n=1 Tax=Paraglaciecola chathamensis TaxID=368405 RepID=A0ABS0WCI4_9ALTE|nr:hypothetical protein [Paraglaciecola chathamensis]MBJ2136128.1 hypothetical protein [Paraglaciecola chathamensis]
MVKRILLLLIVLSVGVFLGWFAHLAASSEDLRKAHAAALSIGLSGDFDVIDALIEKNAFDSEIKAQYDERFAQLILSLKAINPNLHGLSASNTKSWCKLIQYHLDNIISFDDSLDATIDSYVNQFKPIIDREMASVQKIVGGEGCEIGSNK